MRTPTNYDDFARAYSDANASNLLNAGPLAAALRDRGALVSGFDLSPGMVSLARERLGAGTDLRVADLGDRLPYADDAFDVVVCSLALHYLRDWTAPLAELRRILRPGGRPFWPTGTVPSMP